MRLNAFYQILDKSSLKVQYQKNKMPRHQSPFKNRKYTMLKDFYILARSKESQKQLYEQANFEKGIEMMTPTFVRDSNGKKFSLFVPIEEFKQFGPGIYLLFLFLKYGSFLLFSLSIFSFFSIGMLLEGGKLNNLDINFQIIMARTTLGNVQDEELRAIIVFDYIQTILILVGIILWKQKQASYVVQCCKEIMLPSYQTVILKRIPQLYTENDLKIHLEERFGEVLNIYTVRNFNNDLYHYKQITKIVKQFKVERALLKLKPERGSIRLTKLFFDYMTYYFKMQKQSCLQKYSKEFAYITFKSVKSRESMLKFYANTFPRFKGQKRDEHLFKSQELKINGCIMQPDGINWENFHIPKTQKIIWITFQICLLIVILLLSFIVIFTLYVSQSSLSQTEYFGKSKEQIFQMNNIQALQSYCVGLSIASFSVDVDCKQFSSKYIKLTILFIALPLIVALLKFILTQIMKALVNLRRHPHIIAKIESQIIIMFVFYFFTTGILQYIVFLQIKFSDNSTFSFVNIMQPIHKALVGYLDINTQTISMSSDFNRQWYKNVSQKIILIAMVGFNFSSLGKIVYSFLRKFVCDFYSKKQQLQCKMNYWLEGQQLEIQFVYAVAATIICFLLLFGSAMPLVYPLTCLSLLILFWSTKFIFINFCAKPLLYSHSMNSLVINILLIGVIARCFVAPIYYGASSIYSENGISNFMRIPYFGFYIAPMLVAMIYMFYRERIENFCHKIKDYFQQAQKNDDFSSKRQKKMSLPSKLCLIEPPKNQILSYSMHGNPVYQNVLKTLYTINKGQRVRDSCVLNKQLENQLQNDDTFEQAEQRNQSPKIFYELCKITEQNYTNFEKRMGRQYSRLNNPYQLYVKRLKDLDKASKIIQFDPEVSAQMKSQDFKSNSLKSMDIQHLKQILGSNKNLNNAYLEKLENLRKRFKPKTILREILERSYEESISKNINKNSNDYLDQAPNSQVRLRQLVDQGITSHLEMNSKIEGYTEETVSRLEVISKICINSNINDTETLKDLESVYLSKKKISEIPKKDIQFQRQIFCNQPNSTKVSSIQKNCLSSESETKGIYSKLSKQKSQKTNQSKKQQTLENYRSQQRNETEFNSSHNSYLQENSSN